MNATIMLADDDRKVREAIRKALEAEGFAVVSVADGEAALSIALSGRVDLAILDIMMPLLDGKEVLSRLKASGSALPVMFLSSRDAEFDRVLGLELGADDYLPKPFSLRELVARVKALLRRVKGSLNADCARRISAGGVDIDPDACRACRGGQDLGLTLTEFRILLALASRSGQARSREQLLHDAYPEDSYLSDRAIDCHIKRLRRKMAAAGADEGLIETVYGLGYRFAEEKP